MNTIHAFVKKIKRFVFFIREDAFLFLVIFLGVLLVWGVLTMRQSISPQLTITELNFEDVADSVSNNVTIVGNRGSKIFHLEECPGAKAMSEVNKIFFDSISAAIGAGYRAAKNCPQLEYLVK